MNKIEVVNIKCGGCAKSIEVALTKKGFKNVQVDPSCQLVQFEGDNIDLAESVLEKMGYPRVGSKNAHSLRKKAKSYASCMVGRLK
jgi:copper chaperone CopZ